MALALVMLLSVSLGCGSGGGAHDDGSLVPGDASAEGAPCNSVVPFEWSLVSLATGASVTCADVRGAQFVVSVNGVSQSFSCPAGDSSGTFDVEFGAPGTYTLHIELIDSAGAVLSEGGTGPENVTCPASPNPVFFLV